MLGFAARVTGRPLNADGDGRGTFTGRKLTRTVSRVDWRIIRFHLR